LAVFEEEKRRQGAARLGAAGGDQLGRLEDVDRREIAIFGFAFVDVGEGGIGGAEIDADFHGVGQDCADLCMEGGVGAAGRFLNTRNQFRVRRVESVDCGRFSRGVATARGWLLLLRRDCGGARII
jgi:hypothetical protein